MQTLKTQSDRQSKSGSLISHSTILILSGFLIGLASGNVVHPSVRTYVYLAGGVGLVAYFGLGKVSEHRTQQSAQAAVDLAASTLERRMDRHIPAKTPLSGMHTPTDERIWSLREIEQQYRTIVTARRSHFD